jgi:alpha-L-rhamnosidase
VNVIVPPNTTATVYLPAASAAAVTEGGQPVSGAREESGAVVVELGSGEYTFQVGA